MFGYLPRSESLWLKGLRDVDADATPTSNQVLAWSSSTSRWGPATASNTLPQNNFSATVDPTVDDDSGDGYEVGSSWVNTSGNRAFICVDASVGSAIWDPIPAVVPFSNFTATSQPTVSDDETDGYEVGSLWVNTAAENAYICIDPSTGAAVWKLTTDAAQNNFAASAPPAVTDDSYTVGSLWVDTTNDMAYICLDSTTDAASWELLKPPKSNFGNVPAPTTSDDDTEGYTAGSLWASNNSGVGTWVCLDASTGAAVWSHMDRSDAGAVFKEYGTSLPNGVATVPSPWAQEWLVFGGGIFNLTTATFTASVDGKFYYSLGVTTNTFTASTTGVSAQMNIVIITSARTIINVDLIRTGSGSTAAASGFSEGIFDLSSGDTITMEYYQNSGGTRTTRICHLSIFRL